MGYIIALAGKGGTGKTSLAALLVRELIRRRERPVLAVDADPNACLGDALGIEATKTVATVGGLCDQAAGSLSQVPQGMRKEDYLEYYLHSAVVEADGFDLLTMGRPEGAGCYCYVNNLIRKLMEKLIQNYQVVVMDNEAGMEHLSRRTTRAADMLLMISDPSVRGLESAYRCYRLAAELKLGIKRSGVVVNRVQDDLSVPFQQRLTEYGLDLFGIVPEDANLRRLNNHGQPVSLLPPKSPAAASISSLMPKLFKI